jgi:hypothetical protein
VRNEGSQASSNALLWDVLNEHQESWKESVLLDRERVHRKMKIEGEFFSVFQKVNLKIYTRRL